jgi:hypothetical protein
MQQKINSIVKICNDGNFVAIDETEESLKIQSQANLYTYLKKENIEDLFMYDNNNINIYMKTGGFIFINLKERLMISQL